MDFFDKLYNDNEKDYVLKFQSKNVNVHRFALKINFPDLFMVINHDNIVLPDTHISLVNLIYQQTISNYSSLLEVLRYLENFPLSHQNINIKLFSSKDAMTYFINNLTSNDYDNPVIKTFIKSFKDPYILNAIKETLCELKSLMSKTLSSDDDSEEEYITNNNKKIQKKTEEARNELKKSCKFYLCAVELTSQSLRQLHNILKYRNVEMVKLMVDCIGEAYIYHCHSQFILNHLYDFRTVYTDTQILEVIKSNGI